MYRKYYWLVVLLGVISGIYVFVINASTQIPAQLSFIEERIENEFALEKEGIQISGRCYGEVLDQKALIKKARTMERALSHQLECSRICRLEHGNYTRMEIVPIENGNMIRIEGSNGSCNYVFTVKNQKDIHQNTYYELKLTGNKAAEYLDQMSIHANDLLEQWKIEAKKEFIFFEGTIDHSMASAEKEKISQAIFDHLDAARTNYYVDSIEKSTCSYYGYCPYIDEYYKEENGYKTNMQIAFNDNEIVGQTEIRIAFPFYNEVF